MSCRFRKYVCFNTACILKQVKILKIDVKWVVVIGKAMHYDKVITYVAILHHKCNWKLKYESRYSFR